MKTLLILFVFMFMQGCAHQDEWTTRDTWMQVGVTAVIAADAYTTSKIQYDPHLMEAGPIARRILGRQPSTSDTYMYFGTLIISNYFISRALPAKWRPYWQRPCTSCIIQFQNNGGKIMNTITPDQFKYKKRYDTFTIRRPGYWGLLFAISIVNQFIMTGGGFEGGIGGMIFFVVIVSMLVSGAARCRDAGLNGWWCLAMVIPGVQIYFGCIRHDDHPKKMRWSQSVAANADKLRIHDQSGFTLIELMATIVLVFIITIFATPWYGDYVHRAKVAHVIGDIGEIHLRVEMFDLMNGRYPDTLAEIDLPSEVDPWGNPYVYLSFDNINGNGPKRKNRNMVPVNTAYDVYSVGPDGDTATPFTSTAGQDDIVMAGDGTFFGEVGDFE